MGPIKDYLRVTFFHVLFEGAEVEADFRKILDHINNNGSLAVPYPQLSEESAYNTPKEAGE